MTELARNGPMYLSGSFPASFPPTEWEADGATFDPASHSFTWADAEGWLFHQGAMTIEAGRYYLVRVKVSLNGSTVFATLGGTDGPDQSAVDEYVAIIRAGSSAPGMFVFQERAGNPDGPSSSATMVSVREVVMVTASVPVEADLLPS